MGLFGALFAGVSGLSSQSNKISVISNNIANANTVGYKEESSVFSTLVVSSATSGTFSPGGAVSGTQQYVNLQGSIQGTQSPTDLAISDGDGFFVVNTQANGDGTTLYTRVGNFTQNALGQFVNADGYFLQALPVNSNGTVPALNFTNLQTVTVNNSSTGTSTPTSQVSLEANLSADQAQLVGSGVTATLSADNANSANALTDIIVPTSAGTGNGLVQGDTFNIISNNGAGSATTTDTFTYGGFTYGRNVTTSGSTGQSGGVLTTQTFSSGSPASISTNGTNVITLTVANIADYTAGGAVNLSNITNTEATTLGFTSASVLNGEWSVGTVTPTGGGAGTITITVGGTSTVGTSLSPVTDSSVSALTVTNRTYDFSGNILNATSESSDLLENIGTSPFTTKALSLGIAVDGTTYNFTYNSSPVGTAGTFNSLDTLVQAINDSSNSKLTARVYNGQLYVSAANADQAVTFTNGDAAGNGTLAGINWVQELGLSNVSAAATDVNRFNSLYGLQQQIETVDPTNLSATVPSNNSGTATTLNIDEAYAQGTIQFTDGAANTSSSLISALGFQGVNGAALVSSTNTGGGTSLTTDLFAAKYSASDSTRDMSSGAITAQYSKEITVYDAQGNSHILNMQFAKLATNTWAVELTVVPASDVKGANTLDGSDPNDGLVASGTVTFNGDGSLASVIGSIATTANNPITIDWSNGAASSAIQLDLGTAGGINGLTQLGGASNTTVANQNGASAGQLSAVSINSTGFITATYNNGQTQQLYQIPLATVNNPDDLAAVTGNAYSETLASGVANLQIAGDNNAGSITSSALEQSNVDLSTELTNLIVAQQAYGANTKLLTVADTLLQSLDNIIQG